MHFIRTIGDAQQSRHRVGLREAMVAKGEKDEALYAAFAAFEEGCGEDARARGVRHEASWTRRARHTRADQQCTRQSRARGIGHAANARMLAKLRG